MSWIQSKLNNIITNDQVPLLHGATGTGKTTVAKQVLHKHIPKPRNAWKMFHAKTFHLIFPLEQNELTHVIHSIKNNPNQCVLFDNLESANSTIINKVVSWLKHKPRSTCVICISIDPYAQHLRPLRFATTLCPMPAVQKSEAVILARNCNASDETLDKIAKQRHINDYRLVYNIIFHDSACYDSDTELALRNPYKAFSWFLGTHSRINVEHIYLADPFYYSCGVYTNYTKSSTSIDELEHCISTLSCIDVLDHGIHSSIYDKLTTHIQTQYKHKCSNMDIKLPNYTLSHIPLSKGIISLEHRDSIEHIFQILNTQRASKKNTEYIKSLIKSYKITMRIAENAVIQLDTKDKKTKPKLKEYIKKLL